MPPARDFKKLHLLGFYLRQFCRRDFLLKFLSLLVFLSFLSYYVLLQNYSTYRFDQIRRNFINELTDQVNCSNETMRLSGYLPSLSNDDNATEELIGLISKENSSTDSYQLQRGGWWKPPCKAHQDVAVIIPFRDRLEHLMFLLETLHLMLQRQQIAYRIFVAEQNRNGTFNKARIMNIAYAYIRQNYPQTNCMIFHDVDLIPQNDRNIYFCGKQPRHLSPAVDVLGYQLPYPELVGGVLAILPEHFEKANGYSNLYWGWGAEDDDMYYRLQAEKLQIERPSNEIGRYTMMRHKKREAMPNRYKLLWSAHRRYKLDGVAQLGMLNHTILSVNEQMAYTRLLIDLKQERAQ